MYLVSINWKKNDPKAPESKFQVSFDPHADILAYLWVTTVKCIYEGT